MSLVKEAGLIDLLVARSLPLSNSVVMREGDPRRVMPRIFRAVGGSDAMRAKGRK
ncbi:hypothetical protein [Paracoccus sp. NSM]|uniref:hypothetical protein n=1 Tax=Paracoccus sp. NSM TaxID=3457784 RepID=UPI004035D175